MSLIAPSHLISTEYKGGGYTKTNPKRWSDAEIKWCLEKKSEGYSTSEIAEALGRSDISVQIKLKRQTKSNDSYNEKFRELKYFANESFLNHVQPSSVLDVYAGNSWWSQNVQNCVTNDADEKFNTDHHEDAFDLMCQMHLGGRKFDVIDLDPFGSAYECFDLAFRLATKGVVISFGEWGHKRWKRTDFVEPRYGIPSVEDWSEEKFIAEAQRIALLHKKKAVVFDSLQYSNFLRVYFVIERHKETSQWEENKGE